MKKELSIIIPAYNEEERISITLSEVVEFLKREGYRFEVLVMDDGSTDDTAEKVKAISAKASEIRLIQSAKNAGKGEAIKQGIAFAQYEYVLFMDADNSTSIKEWPAFEVRFDGGYLAVSASRHLPGAQIIHPQPFARRFLGAGYRSLCRFLFGLRFSDFNCGFKAYRTDVAKKIYAQARIKDWTFDVEAFCLLKKLGIPVAEAPIRWEHHDKKSHSAPWITALRSLRSLAKLKNLMSGR